MEPLQRVTAPTLDVLQALLAQEEPLWGLVLIKTTGRPSGTVYPILERLERQGWITGSWDDDPDRSGPRRRRYAFTGRAGSPPATSSRPPTSTGHAPPRDRHGAPRPAGR